MNKIILLGGVIVGGGVLIFLANQPQVVHVTNDRQEPVIQVETVDVLQARITSAQDAARADIEAKGQEAYQAFVDKELDIIRQEVTSEYIAELEQSISIESY